VLLGLTDFLIGAGRRRQGGVEAATATVGLCQLVGFVAWLCLRPPALQGGEPLALISLAAAALGFAAAWRWGYPLCAAAGAAALFVPLAQLPVGRAAWIVLPLAAAPLLLRGSESRRLPPAHRASCTAVLGVALVALYLAVSLFSWEHQWIEHIGDRYIGTPQPGGLVWWAAAACTALVPIALLAFGVRRRRYPVLLAGIAATIASLVTLRIYVHFLPLWASLALGGLLLFVAALAVQRHLESGRDGERGGFTAAPLFTSGARQRILEAGAAIVAFTPPAAEPAPGGDTGFTGGGGRSGGGGATADF
jgi:hypothetical protein